MIINLFYAVGKQKELQSRVKGQIPQKGTAIANSCLEKLSSKIHFCFENEYDSVPELLISRQKIE